MTTNVEFVNADVLTVGPDEHLIIRIGEMSWTPEVLDDLMAHLKEVGLAERVLVIQGEQIEFAKVKA